MVCRRPPRFGGRAEKWETYPDYCDDGARNVERQRTVYGGRDGWVRLEAAPGRSSLFRYRGSPFKSCKAAAGRGLKPDDRATCSAWIRRKALLPIRHTCGSMNVARFSQT